MAETWNNGFNTGPVGSSTPANTIDVEIQKTRAAVQERMAKEMNFDLSNSSSQGYLKMGAGRVFYQETEPTDVTSGNALQDSAAKRLKGRIWVKLTSGGDPTGEIYVHDGENWEGIYIPQNVLLSGLATTFIGRTEDVPTRMKTDPSGVYYSIPIESGFVTGATGTPEGSGNSLNYWWYLLCVIDANSRFALAINSFNQDMYVGQWTGLLATASWSGWKSVNNPIARSAPTEFENKRILTKIIKSGLISGGAATVAHGIENAVSQWKIVSVSVMVKHPTLTQGHVAVGTSIVLGGKAAPWIQWNDTNIEITEINSGLNGGYAYVKVEYVE